MNNTNKIIISTVIGLVIIMALLLIIKPKPAVSPQIQSLQTPKTSIETQGSDLDILESELTNTAQTELDSSLEILSEEQINIDNDELINIEQSYDQKSF